MKTKNAKRKEKKQKKKWVTVAIYTSALAMVLAGGDSLLGGGPFPD